MDHAKINLDLSTMYKSYLTWSIACTLSYMMSTRILNLHTCLADMSPDKHYHEGTYKCYQADNSDMFFLKAHMSCMDSRRLVSHLLLLLGCQLDSYPYHMSLFGMIAKNWEYLGS